MEDTFKGTKYRAERKNGRKMGFRGWKGVDF
jgi:hypothetical protein